MKFHPERLYNNAFSLLNSLRSIFTACPRVEVKLGSLRQISRASLFAIVSKSTNFSYSWSSSVSKLANRNLAAPLCLVPKISPPPLIRKSASAKWNPSLLPTSALFMRVMA